MIHLRQNQIDALQQLRLKLRSDLLRLILIAPCGFGKTIVAAEMIRSAVSKNKRVAFIAGRRELIDQTMDKLERLEVQAGVVMGSDWRRDDYLPVQVCTIQTLARRLDRLPPADLVIVDECHGAYSESHKKVLAQYGGIPVIGLTATPFRADKRGLGDIFQDTVMTATTRDLINQGFLVDYDAFAYTCPELHEVQMRTFDYDQEQLGLAVNTSILVGSIVREYLKHARGRRALVFAVNVAHSEHIAQEFRDNGVPAAHVDADTPNTERKQAILDFATGKLMVMTSVDIFSEGFDAPAAEVAILARPTKSLTKYIQQVGRVLRISPETGKKRALLHCHSGNILRHGFVDDPRSYSLTSTPDHVRALFTCPACYEVFGAIRRDGRCPKCGELIAEPHEVTEKGERRVKDEVEGDRIGVEQIRKMREMRDAAGIRNDLTDRQLQLAAHATRQEKAGEYLRLKQVQESKGLKKGFVGHQFRAVFSVWPKFTDEELAAAKPAARPFLNLPRHGSSGTSLPNSENSPAATSGEPTQEAPKAQTDLFDSASRDRQTSSE